MLGFTRETPSPPGGEIARDGRGEPTGLLAARPSALILSCTLAKGPTPPFEQQVNSTRPFKCELNRPGVTSVIDAGGGGRNYPDDDRVIEHLHADGRMTVRIACNLFAQKAGRELGDHVRWIAMTEPGAGDPLLRMNGAGENLVWSARDFENFLEPRPDPRVAPWRMKTGRTLGELSLHDESQVLARATALPLWKQGSAWFSGEGGVKGALMPGALADLAVLSADCFTVPPDDVRGFEAAPTVMGGRIVHGSGDFGPLAPRRCSTGAPSLPDRPR